MKIKNCFYFRRAAAAIALFFAIPMLTAAGQFDALHQGIAQNTDTLIGNWQQFSPVSRAKSTRHLKKDERQEILFSTAMPLRSHGMSPKTVPLRSTPLTQAISDRSAIPRITSSFSRGFRSKVKTSISLPDAILSLHPFPWPKKDLVTL